MKRRLPFLAPGLAMTLGCSYLLIPRFSLGINQVFEMLSTGNTRGLMMFFHSAGALDSLLAVGIGTAAFLVPVLKPAYLLGANTEYFGAAMGSLLTFISAAIALGVLVLAGYSLGSLLPSTVRSRLKAIPYLGQALALACTVWLLIRL